jgi:hypothetical protein
VHHDPRSVSTFLLAFFKAVFTLQANLHITWVALEAVTPDALPESGPPGAKAGAGSLVNRAVIAWPRATAAAS